MASFSEEDQDKITIWTDPFSKCVVLETSSFILKLQDLVEVKELAFRLLDETTKLENHLTKPTKGSRKLGKIAKNYAKKAVNEWEQTLASSSAEQDRPEGPKG